MCTESEMHMQCVCCITRLHCSLASEHSMCTLLSLYGHAEQSQQTLPAKLLCRFKIIVFRNFGVFFFLLYVQLSVLITMQ